MRGTGEVWDAQEKFGMHREVWNACEKTWDAQRGVGCTGRFGVHREVWDAQGSLGWTGRCRMHGEIWDAQGGVGCIGRCGMHWEIWDVWRGVGCIGSTQDPWQGRDTWHTTSSWCHVCAGGWWHRGVTAAGSPGRAALGPAQRQLPGIQRLEGEENLPPTLEEDRFGSLG